MSCLCCGRAIHEDACFCEACRGWAGHELQRLLPRDRAYKAWTIAAHLEDLEAEREARP